MHCAYCGADAHTTEEHEHEHVVVARPPASVTDTYKENA